MVATQTDFFDNENKKIVKSHGYVLDISHIESEDEQLSDEFIENWLKNNRPIKKLKGDGDFRSKECINFFLQADIVVTNPPFSLFKEMMSLLVKYQKKYFLQ